MSENDVHRIAYKLGLLVGSVRTSATVLKILNVTRECGIPLEDSFESLEMVISSLKSDNEQELDDYETVTELLERLVDHYDN